MADSQPDAVPEHTTSPVNKQITTTDTTAQQTASLADGKPFLLTIAPEIRNNIYELVMCKHAGLHSGQGIVGAYKDRQGDECTIPVLAQTCRQVRSEILPVSRGSKTSML